MAFEGISTFNENPLHAALKLWYGGPDAAFEVPVDGYVVDCVLDGMLVEIQTANFSAIRRKIEALLPNHRVRLVHPIAVEKWIVRVDRDSVLGRRKSPKQGQISWVFTELVTLAHVLRHPNFSLDVVLTREEDVRRVDAPKRRRRKGWVREERRLKGVVDHRLFLGPADFSTLIPAEVADPFTTADISKAAGIPRWLAQKMTYCLRAMGQILPVSRCKAGVLYERAPTATDPVIARPTS